MRFAEPGWLLAGLAAVIVLLVLYRRFDLRQRAALAEFASRHLLEKLTASFSPGRRRVKRALFALALVFASVALARPQWGYHWQEEKQRGIDILFALDTSKSMLTQDVAPDRLTRAKLAITDFVRKLQGDRIGLIAFAGEAFLQAPLTLDYDAFQESLDAIDTSTIPRGGTDISSAIAEAQAAFGDGTHNKKILLLVTDGEDLEAKGIDSARAAAKDGLVIYTVGVGSPAGGLIPVPVANGGTDFVRDPSGAYVKSHLDESTLKQIAQVTGGIYAPLGQQGQGLQEIYNKALASMPKHELASRREKVYEERFQWPLTAGLAFLLASILIGTRRGASRPGVRLQASRAVPAGVAMLALLLIPAGARASVQSAEKAYKRGDYPAAESQYGEAAEKHPNTAPIQFNYGAAAYKSGAFDTALPAFQKALSSEDVGVQQQAYYDMGNTQYRMGQKTEKAKPEDTMKTWQSAVDSYDAALKLKPEDADAQYNRDFVAKKLQQLKKQNQQKQDQKNQQKNDQDKNQQDKNQQDKNQQNQSGQDQKQPDSNGSGQPNQPQSGSKQGQQDKGGQQDQNQNGQNTPQNGQNQAQNSSKNQGGTAPKDQGQQQSAENQPQPQGGGQQPQNGSQGDQQSQSARNDEKPAGPRGATIPDKDTGQDKEQASEAESAPPGQLTKQEAKDLLNSLKNGEHVLPVAADARSGQAKPQDDLPIKDW